MIKLSEVLSEAMADERIDTPSKLVKIFQNGRFKDLQRPLYRATHKRIYRAEIHKIRKDRKPLDTPQRVHYLVSAMSEREEYSKYPSREGSKFAAGINDEEYLKQYGNNIYYCFPEADAKIASLDDDAFHIMNGIAHEMPNRFNQLETYFGEDVTRSGKSKEEYQERRNSKPHLYKFVQSLHNFNWESYKEVIRKNLENIKSEVQQIIDDYDYGRVDSHDLLDALKQAEDYFDELYPGILGMSEEVMFDGDLYLMVNKRWFNENFEYKNEWKLKDE